MSAKKRKDVAERFVGFAKCPNCQCFLRPDRLQKHLRTKHPGWEPNLEQASVLKPDQNVSVRDESAVRDGKVPTVAIAGARYAAARQVKAECLVCTKRFLGTHIWAHIRSNHRNAVLPREFKRDYGTLPGGPFPPPRIPAAKNAASRSAAEDTRYTFERLTGDPDGRRWRTPLGWLLQGGRCNGR